MARFEILIKRSAIRELRKIPRQKDRRRILARIRALGDDPRPRGYHKISGRNRYRIRQGVYRIVYSIEDDRLIVYIVRVGHRKDVYR